MTRGKLQNYKRKVVYILVKHFNWDQKRAIIWTNDNHEYMRAMFLSFSPHSATAAYIAQMEENNG